MPPVLLQGTAGVLRCKERLRYFYIIYKPLCRAGCSGFFVGWGAPLGGGGVTEECSLLVAKENLKSVRFAVKPQTFPPPPKSRPLGEGGCERSEQTEGVLPPESPTGCIQIDISICCVLRQGLIYQPGGIRTFFALLIYQFRLGSYSTRGRGNGRRRE